MRSYNAAEAGVFPAALDHEPTVGSSWLQEQPTSPSPSHETLLIDESLMRYVDWPQRRPPVY